MGFDPWTLWIVVVTIASVVAVAVLYAWFLTPAEKALGYWCGALVLILSGIVLGLLRERIPEFIVIFFGNGLILLGYAMLWGGMRRFRARAVPLWQLLLVPGLWVALCLVPPFDGSVAARLVLISVLASALLGLSIYEVCRPDMAGLQSRFGLIMAFSIMLVITLSRIGLVTTFVDGQKPVVLTSPSAAWFGLAGLGAVFLACFTLVLMVRERAELVYRHAAHRDELTGLPNRRSFYARAEAECRRGGGIALMLLDLDHFKQVNDRFGHAAGDQLLATFGRVLNAELSAGDIVGRLGGEEFAVLIPQTDITRARARAETLITAFRSESRTIGFSDERLEPVESTVSIGLAFVPLPPGVDAQTAESRLRRLSAHADAMLYAAKAAGRSRVECIKLTADEL